MDYILLIIYIIGFFVILVILYSLKKSIKSPINRVLDKFSGLFGVYITLSVILAYILFKQEVTQIKIDTTLKSTDYAWTQINNKFVEYYDKCPNFIDTLYFDWQKKYINNSNKKKENNDDWTAINYLCISIYQAFHYVLIVNELDQTDEKSWIGAFLNWTTSPIVRQYWNVMRNNYPKITQKFIDLLIDMNEKYPCKNLDEYKKLIDYIINTKEYKDINDEVIKTRNNNFYIKYN